MSDFKLLICGGGTGGHVYPAMAVVEQLQSRGMALSDMLWIGTHGEMETQLVPRAGVPLQTIAGGPIAGMPRRTQLKNGVRLTGSVASAARLIGRFRPNVALLTGGYVNLPVAIANKLMRVPTAIYLPDVEPGAAIKRIEPLVQKIACTAEESAEFLPQDKLAVTGFPVRSDLRAALSHSKAQARDEFGLDHNRPTLFVFGGSRGAQSINQALMAVLTELLQFAQVIHVSGTLTWPEVETFSAEMPTELRQYYRPFPYLHEEMGAAFRAADLVLARAGASMLGECPAFGVPAILIPYPHAWRYQKVNADYLVSRGAGIRINDENMQQELLPTLTDVLQNGDRLRAMQEAAQVLDRPNAAANIVAVLDEIKK